MSYHTTTTKLCSECGKPFVPKSPNHRRHRGRCTRIAMCRRLKVWYKRVGGSEKARAKRAANGYTYRYQKPASRDMEYAVRLPNWHDAPWERAGGGV